MVVERALSNVGTGRSERQSTSLRRRSSASRHRPSLGLNDREGLQSLVENAHQPVPKSFWDRLGIHPFQGMWKDIQRRAPYYVSDWTDALTYRVIPSTFDMFFKKYVS